ncbi:MAG: hypothetical protein AAGK79_13385 [Pseudomonadota bacterium]
MVEKTEAIRVLMQFEADQATRKTKSYARQVEALERRFDPVARATQRYERNLKALEKALEAGTIDSQRYQKNLDALNAEMADATTRSANMNRAMNGGRSFGNLGSLAQQAGYQFQDFAVQVQGGTSAVTAFAQQGSQFLGAFGTYGAVAGAVLAIAAPLASAFMQGRDGAGEMADTVLDLTDALENLNAEAAEANAKVRAFAIGASNTSELVALEEIAAKRKEIAELESQLEGKSARQLARGSGNDAKRLADLKEELANLQRTVAEREKAVAAAEKLARVQEMANQAAKDYLRRIEAEEKATSEVAAQVREMERQAAIQSLIVQYGENSLEVSLARAQAEREAYVELLNSKDIANALKYDLLDAWDAANGIAVADMAGNIQFAATAAGTLARNLAMAARGNALLKASRKNPDFFDPRNESGLAGETNPDKYNPPLTLPGVTLPPNPRRSGGGGGGGGRSGGGSRGAAQSVTFGVSTERLERQLELLGKSTGEVARLEERWRLLDEAKRKNITVTDELAAKIDAEAARVGDLTAQYEATQDEMEAFEERSRQLKETLLDAATSGVDSFDDLKDAIKRAALEYLLFGEGMFAGKNNKFGGIFGGFAGLFDKGGDIPRGQFGIVGERGPEIVRGPASVTSRADTARMMGGVVVGDIGVSVDDDGKIAAYVKSMGVRAAQQGAASAVGEVRRNFGSYQREIDASGAIV